MDEWVRWYGGDPELIPEWYRQSVEALWPGLTAYAERSPQGVVVGITEGLVIFSVPTDTLFSDASPASPYAPELPLIGSFPEITLPIYPPADMPWSTDLRRLVRWPGMTDAEAAAVAGMVFWYDRAAGVWRRMGAAGQESPLSQEDAEQAADYLRGRLDGPQGERRSWFRRGVPVRELPWRKGPIWRDLNGPTAEPWARWFSTATTTYPMGSLPDLPTAVRENARTYFADAPVTVAARWDWRAYTYHPDPWSLSPPPDSYRGPADGPDAPWPIWADERTAWRRLVQRAAELLFDANEEQWQGSDARRRVKVPEGDEWGAIAKLLSDATADARLYFGDKPQDQWGAVSYSAEFGSGTAITLWRVFHGWSHLRRCTTCDRWVLSGGQRAKTLCDASCKQERHRQTPRWRGG